MTFTTTLRFLLLLLVVLPFVSARLGGSDSRRFDSWETDEQIILDLAQRLEPHELETTIDPVTNHSVATTHQFFHLHHMKTGGTSINVMMNCALDRARRTMKSEVSFYSLSECSESQYKRCIEDANDSCRPRINSSATMTYCAPLFQTNQLEWQDAKAITVLRHPVDRVWSMFRFQTRGCYQCRNLTNVFTDIDEHGVDETSSNVCLPQLVNHQTRNLLTSPLSQNLTDDEKIAEAIDNMKNRFTVVGLTDQLPLTVQMIGQAFPWMAEHLESDGDNHQNDCPLQHANASPQNNHCGPDGKSHWELPDEPDEETRQAILRHNQLDVKLYEAAVEHFELQKRALGWDEQEGRR